MCDEKTTTLQKTVSQQHKHNWMLLLEALVGRAFLTKVEEFLNNTAHKTHTDPDQTLLSYVCNFED